MQLIIVFIHLWVTGAVAMYFSLEGLLLFRPHCRIYWLSICCM